MQQIHKAWTARGARADPLPSPITVFDRGQWRMGDNEKQQFRAPPQRPLCTLVCSRYLATKPTLPANPHLTGRPRGRAFSLFIESYPLG